jgi:hypothetical protein
MTTLFLRLAAAGALLTVAAAHTAMAAEEPSLQALATCQDSWFEWKNDAARMAHFADYMRTRFVPGEGGDAYSPKVKTMALGYQVSQVYPQSVGMGLGFSMVVQANFAQARQAMEKQLGRTMTCSISDGVEACEIQLGEKKTAVLMTGNGGKAATSLLGCYYFYQQ